MAAPKSGPHSNGLVNMSVAQDNLFTSTLTVAFLINKAQYKRKKQKVGQCVTHPTSIPSFIHSKTRKNIYTKSEDAEDNGTLRLHAYTLPYKPALPITS